MSTDCDFSAEYHFIRQTCPFNQKYSIKAKQFADANLSGVVNNYQSRVKRSLDVTKIRQDIWGSKYSEQHCENYFRNWCIEHPSYQIIKGVDFAQYEQKTWDPDLVVGHIATGLQINISCKFSRRKLDGILYDLNGKKLGFPYPQYTWTIQEEDLAFKEDRSRNQNILEILFLMNYNEESKKLGLYAWLKNDLAIKLFVMPFDHSMWRRFENGKWTGKKCIMMNTCSTISGFPCGVGEIRQRVQ
jgi:hypothetical protein